MSNESNLHPLFADLLEISSKGIFKQMGIVKPMRDIKFRAWNQELKRMESDIPLDHLKVYGSTINQTLPALAIMQYTGLKDKNGIEIYEGDICRGVIRGKNIEVIGEIKMPKSCWILLFKNPENGYLNMRRTANFIEIEVLGNIYQK